MPSPSRLCEESYPYPPRTGNSVRHQGGAIFCRNRDISIISAEIFASHCRHSRPLRNRRLCCNSEGHIVSVEKRNKMGFGFFLNSAHPSGVASPTCDGGGCPDRVSGTYLWALCNSFSGTRNDNTLIPVLVCDRRYEILNPFAPDVLFRHRGGPIAIGASS